MTIVSHKHKLIFLKTRKTAGSSIEASLIRYCGPDDIISSAVDVENLGIAGRHRNDIIKLKELDLHGWSYYIGSVYKHISKRASALKFPEKEKLLPRYVQHMPASDVRRAVGTSVWKNYFKVCFERNPYDRLVSFYYWRRKKIKDNCSFSEFAKVVLKGNIRQQNQMAAINFSNRPFYLDKDDMIVDFVGRYENLKVDFSYICGQCGIEFDGWLPMAKSSTRKNRQYRSMYTPELRFLADEGFRMEKKLFGYEF